MTLNYDRDQPQATSSAAIPHKPRCAVCNFREAIYTCPRCSLRSCSAVCAASHKNNKNCSGERNKAAYVPMNKYTWGTMMNDYVFLEDMGRKVGNWGDEIVRGGYRNATEAKGRGVAKMRKGGTRTKRDVLKLQLEARDIDMGLLPHGMERKKVNQSSWDSKKKTAQLTIEFKLHAPADLPKEPPFRTLTHRNDMNTPLLKLIQTHISTMKRSNVPPWASSLVLPDADYPETFTMPNFLMPAQRDVYPTSGLVAHPSRSVYYRFDPTQSLATLLKGTRFVEFPTIEVCQEFNGTVVDAAGCLSRVGDDHPRVKRRKLTLQAGRAALDGLVGEYGSGEEDTPKQPPVLVAYTNNMSEEEDAVSTDDSNESADEGNDEDIKVEPAVLLELLREARNRGQWTEDIEVDWGEGSEGESELDEVRDLVGGGQAGPS